MQISNTVSTLIASSEIQGQYTMTIVSLSVSQTGDTQWPSIATEFCNGSRQSPIDIVSANAVPDSSLGAFTFTGFNDTTAMTKMKNSGGKTGNFPYT